jgi:Tfp pilus assembly protein PilF
VALGLVFTGLAVAARAGARTHIPPEHDGLSARLAQACYGTWFYLVKTAIPRDITAFYPLPSRVDWLAPPFLASILATVAVSAGLFVRRRRWPGPLAAWLSYLVLLVPSSGLVRIGNQLAADRYSYLSMTGLVVLAAAGLGRPWASARRGAAVGLTVAAAVLVLALVPLARAQCRAWHDSGTLWAHALQHGVPSATAHNGLGWALLHQGRIEEAATQFDEAIRRDAGLPLARFGMGSVRSSQGRIEEALSQFDEAIRLKPGFAEVYNERAMILAAGPDPRYRDGKQAVAAATRACELTGFSQPSYLDTLAAAHAEAGDFAAAAAWQEKAIGLVRDQRRRDAFRSRLELYRAGRPYREPAPQGLPTGAGRSRRRDGSGPDGRRDV